MDNHTLKGVFNGLPYMCGQIISVHELENLYEISCLGFSNIYVGDEEKALAIAKCYREDGHNFIMVRCFQLYKCIEDIEYDELIIYDSRVDKKVDDCRQRLHDEYWELVTRIEKLEMELLKSSLDADAKELLIEQRKAMLAYKDALFRRCFHHNVDLYRDTTTQTAI